MQLNEIEELMGEIGTKIDFLMLDKNLNYGNFLDVKSMKEKYEKITENVRESKNWESIFEELKQISKILDIIIVENNFKNTVTADV